MEKILTIWSNEYYLSDEEAKEYAEHCEVEDDISFDEIRDIHNDHNNMHLDYLRDLGKNTYEDVIILADLGLWHGRVKYAYKHLGYVSLNKCLYSDNDFITWYLDRYNFCCKGIHHDGTNFYTYRAFKDNLTNDQKENFMNKIYAGKATKQDITRYTKSLKPIIEKLEW